jgi:hypothetical protein
MSSQAFTSNDELRRNMPDLIKFHIERFQFQRADLAGLCRDCDACAESCENIGDMEECPIACRDCAESCGKCVWLIFISCRGTFSPRINPVQGSATRLRHDCRNSPVRSPRGQCLPVPCSPARVCHFTGSREAWSSLAKHGNDAPAGSV